MVNGLILLVRVELHRISFSDEGLGFHVIESLTRLFLIFNLNS